MTSFGEWHERQRKEESGSTLHFAVYILINSFLIGLWWFTGGLAIFPWFLFPLLGWGIGIIGHALAVFRGPPYIERKTQEEYRRLKKQQEL